MGERTPKTHPLHVFLDKNPTIDFIRFQFMEYSSVLLVRVATKAYALSLALSNGGISLPTPMLTAGLVNGDIMWEDCELGMIPNMM